MYFGPLPYHWVCGFVSFIYISKGVHGHIHIPALPLLFKSLTWWKASNMTLISTVPKQTQNVG